MAESVPGCVQVVVAHSPAPGVVTEWPLVLPAGSTVQDALNAIPHATGPSFARAADTAVVGIWGRRVARLQPLRDGDRVELYRPLTVDPKVARRERFAQQGRRSAGLFSLRGQRGR